MGSSEPDSRARRQRGTTSPPSRRPVRTELVGRERHRRQPRWMQESGCLVRVCWLPPRRRAEMRWCVLRSQVPAFLLPGTLESVGMQSHGKKSSGAGLERSCSDPAGDWLRSTGPEDGVEYLEAWFRSATYRRHRHDTYAICVTTGGVQAFYYRGTTETSTTGQVVILHPDELHDGYAATDAGYGYRQIYIEPALIFEAVQVLRGHPCPLPFVRTPVVTSSKLSQAVTRA